MKCRKGKGGIRAMGRSTDFKRKTIDTKVASHKIGNRRMIEKKNGQKETSVYG